MSFPLESVNLISYNPLERLYAAQIIFEFLIKMCIAINCPIPHRKAPKMHHCTDPQMLDQKSNDWRSIFLWLNIVLNLKRK